MSEFDDHTREVTEAVLSAFDEVPSPWRGYARLFDVPDFKPISFATIPETSEMLLSDVAPDNDALSGDKKPATLRVTGPSLSVVTRGRVFSTSLNEDIGDTPAAYGRYLGEELAGEAANVLQGNPIAYDGRPLFCEEHRNVLDADLDADAILTAVGMLGEQADPHGNPISLRPHVLLVGNELADEAEKALTLARAEATALGSDILDDTQVVVDEHFAGHDWHLLASPQHAPVVGIAFLDGEQRPAVFCRPKDDSDDLDWKVRHEWGVSVFDWRGGVKARARS